MWTDAKRQLLAQMWERGKTASQIAYVLGVTRNAVIGMSRRMGCARRPDPINRSDGLKVNKARKPAKLRESDARAAIRRPQEPARPRHEAGRTCQWIDGDGPPWAYCGAPTVDGSWCEAHRARVFQKPVAG